MECWRIPASTPSAHETAYSRVVRFGPHVAVPQTSAADKNGSIAGGDDPYAQAVHALQNVYEALRAGGAQVRDVIRTRIYLARFEDWTEVARAHAEVFGDLFERLPTTLS